MIQILYLLLYFLLGLATFGALTWLTIAVDRMSD